VILDWLIAPILTFVTGLLGDLPTGGFGFTTGSGGTTGATNLADEIAGFLGDARFFLPSHLVLVILGTVFGFMIPALFVYLIAQWGYRELPTIAGFGPSS